MAPVESRGGTHRYVIEKGAWIRGGIPRDLVVVVTHGDAGSLDRISISHRSMTRSGLADLLQIFDRHGVAHQ